MPNGMLYESGVTKGRTHAAGMRIEGFLSSWP